ncbi:HNH endonuclease [Acinetobacter sp.]|uniref:HNH endonuclease n=1 Tax=Acinetobacter sp. TaxID=472 RepID=UPI0025B7F455|nr:HNH endonuclease [Acinetobacter sp.]
MNILLHRAVAETFLTNKENLPIVNHKDGDKLNNAVSNLEWCSSKNNHSHAVDTGLIKLRGEDNIRSIFTKKDIRAIRVKLKSGTSTRKLAAELDCSRSAIQHIKKGRSWQWL